MMRSMILIVTLAGERVGLQLAAVGSVVEIAKIVPVPLAPPHIAGLAALRSRVLTIVDPGAALGESAECRAISGLVVSVSHEGHDYGLLVDAVEDVIVLPDKLLPVALPLPSAWVAVASGMADYGGDWIVVLDPTLLVAGSVEAIAA